MLRLLLLTLLSVLLTTSGEQHFESEKQGGGKSNNEEFFEELYVRPLSDGFVSTYFQFTTRWHFGEKENLHNTRLIPRPIAEILLQYDVKELHISLTQGLWRYENWGYPVVDAAPGAEAWAWFAAQNLTEEAVDYQWARLANTFSGILCASLNFIDKTNSIEPKYGFRPQYMAGKNAADVPKFLRYATLPREIVCTENLTPWKKLLPCDSRNGFASLLHSGHVHNTNYHSLGLRVRTICESFEENCRLELTQTAMFVYDPKLLNTVSIGNDFSLRRLFGQGLNGYCILAESSKIYVHLDDQKRFELTPEPMYNISSMRGGTQTRYGVYDIQVLGDEKLFNIAWLGTNKQQNPHVAIFPKPPIYAHRYLLGHGQERGQVITEITNNHYGALPILLQENIPWFVPIYMHTLKLKVLSQNGHQETRELQPKFVYYRPGSQRSRAYHLELGAELPPKSVVQVSFDFDYMFLKWLEYPPDANHGHYIGSAVITTQLTVGRNYTSIPVDGTLFADSFNATRSSYYLELRTESLILSLPTPDFSMPYNVICLACTVVALAFGPIHSVATKRIIVEQKDSASSGSLLKRIYLKLRGRKRASQARTEPAEEELEEHNSAERSDEEDLNALGNERLRNSD